MLPFTFYRTVRVGCPVFIWRHTMKEEKIKVLALLPIELPKEIEPVSYTHLTLPTICSV